MNVLSIGIYLAQRRVNYRKLNKIMVIQYKKYMLPEYYRTLFITLLGALSGNCLFFRQLPFSDLLH